MGNNGRVTTQTLFFTNKLFNFKYVTISVGVDYRPIDYIRDFRDLDFIATLTNVNIGLTYLSAPYVLHATCSVD